MASARARLGVLVAIGLAIAIGVVVLASRGGEREQTAREPAGSASARATAQGAKDPATGLPRWLGQRGAATRRIAGVVILDGAPVPGAVVRLASKLTASGLGAEPRVVADGAGRFDLGPQLAAAYLVIADKPQLTAAIESIDLRDPSTPVDQLRLVMHACDASIHGTIRDSSGGVIPKARVVLSDGRMTTGAGAEASDEGDYELCVPVGGVAVVVQADGYGDLHEGINAFGRMQRDFSLLPEATVGGRVVREDDQTPVAGAIVELHSDEPRAARRFASSTTSSDADGRFQFTGAGPGRHVVTAVADGLATRRPVDVIAEIGQPQNDVVCALAPTHVIAGKILEQGTRAPQPGVTIGMVQRTSRDPRRRLEAVTQPDGSFVIEHAFPGDYEPYVPNFRLAATPRPKVTITNADVTGLVYEVERLASVSGRVLRGGKPVDGAQLNASQTAYAQSEHDGTYTIRGLEAGTFQIYAESKRIGAFTNGPKVTLVAGEQKAGVDVEMELSASIAGSVVDQNDAPVAGVTLSFTLLRGRDFGVATTADDGTFSARALSGGGDYAYEVRQGDGASLAYPPVTGRRHPPITVRDGASQITGVRIKIRRERLAIAGRVLDAAGAPVADVAVTATPVGGYTRSPSAATDEAGAFTIRDLPAGTYNVFARAARSDQHEANVAAGRRDVVLRLPGVGGIDGTLAGFAAPPEVLAMGSGGGGRYRATVAGETFRFRDLPAGTYHVVATSSSGLDFAKLEVPATAIATLALRQRGVGTVAGTVVDEKTRTPLVGLRCTLASESEQWGYERPRGDVAITDGRGGFSFDRVLAGNASVSCARDATDATGEVTAIAGETTRLDLTARTVQVVRRAHIGLELEVQLGDVMVKAVETGGAAARAGLAVGDVILQINGRAIPGWQADDLVSYIEEGDLGTSVKLAIERADKPLTVLLTVDPAP